MFYFEWKDKREFMKGSNSFPVLLTQGLESNDFEILRSLSVSRDLEKSVQNSAGNSGECTWHDITRMIYSEKAWSRKSS